MTPQQDSIADTTDRIPARRDVFVGRHSKVWRALSCRPQVAERRPIAIGHADIPGFEFTRGDRVWLLSYSRRSPENRAMLEAIARAGAGEIVYVSSSATIVDDVTRCYEYPRVKREAEQFALSLPAARVLTIGLVYEDPTELPCGACAATSLAELAAFIAMPEWPDAAGRRKRLMRIMKRPFRHAGERWAFGAYGHLMHWARAFPCALRPLDLLLRTLGVRWYGYTFLSNRLWSSTIS
jgi:hypothetical protein